MTKVSYGDDDSECDDVYGHDDAISRDCRDEDTGYHDGDDADENIEAAMKR